MRWTVFCCAMSAGNLAKANDHFHGRILRLEQNMTPSPRWIVAIRFDTIERRGIEQPIALKPVDDGVRGKAKPEVVDRPEGAGVFIFVQHGNFVLDQKFHSEWETR